jgi:hypothetical protein
MLIAWGLARYPLLRRTQPFLVPMYVLLLAGGVVFPPAAMTAAVHASEMSCLFRESSERRSPLRP